VESNHEVQLLLVVPHRHLKVLHTFELLSLFFNREVLEITNEASGLLHDLVCESGRVQAVLRGDIEATQMTLELQEALMVRLLDEKLVSFVIDYHFERAQVQVAVASR